jgi:hypothetical protein
MTTKKKKVSEFDNGHWQFHDQMDPDKYFGFTYLIRCTETGKKYIGRKQYKHAGKKTGRNYGKEMKWRTYAGSSVHLAKHIKSCGLKNVEFICLGEYMTRGDLVYAEVWEQITRDALRKKLINGEREYFNGQVAAIKFIPPDKPCRLNLTLRE